jgi:aarF domain-containing kinase
MQILCTCLFHMQDFVPEPWIRRLSNHLDNAPPRPFPEVELSIMQQLSTCPCKSSLPVNSQGLVPLDAVFMDVDRTALAAASIAQVHTGMLKDGSQVVIKVQHFGMEKVMASDLRNIGWVAKFLEGQLPFDLGPIVKEIQATIPLEFDFLREVWFMVNYIYLGC